MFHNNQIFTLSPNVLSQEIDQEIVLLDMKSERYFGLNDVGRHVLELLKFGSDFNTLVASLLEIYEVEQDQLEIDLVEILQQLLIEGLILKSSK